MLKLQRHPEHRGILAQVANITDQPEYEVLVHAILSVDTETTNRTDAEKKALLLLAHVKRTGRLPDSIVDHFLLPILIGEIKILDTYGKAIDIKKKLAMLNHA